MIHDYDAPTPSQSVEMMRDIDALSRPLRLLCYEYGPNIVGAMIDSGYKDPLTIRDMLRTRRATKQAARLAKDDFTPDIVEKIAAGFAQGFTRMNRRRHRRRRD